MEIMDETRCPVFAFVRQALQSAFVQCIRKNAAQSSQVDFLVGVEHLEDETEELINLRSIG